LGEDKILDAPPGLDMGGLGGRDVGSLARSFRQPKRKRSLSSRVVRGLVPFLLGIGLGGFLYYHFTSDSNWKEKTGAGLFSYPVSGIRVERSALSERTSQAGSSLFLSPDDSVRIAFGRETLRFISMERSSAAWAALTSLLAKPPTLFLDDRPVQAGQDLAAMVEPERSLSYGLVLRSPDGGIPVASFRMDVDMDAKAWLDRSRELKEPQQQRFCLEQAERADPENIAVLMALGNLLWEEKDASAAAQRFQEVLKKDPEHLEAAKALASIHWKSQPKKAIAAYETLVKIDPQNQVDHYKQIARLQERLGVSPAETYRKILSLQKNDPDAMRGVDNLYAKQVARAQQAEKKGDLPKAIQEMKQALELHRSKEGLAYLATLYNNLAYSLSQQSKFKEAIPHYEASLKIDEDAITYLNLADAYSRTNNPSSALKAVEKAYGLKPKDSNAQKNILLLWSELLISQKDFAHAIPKLEELRSRFPKDPRIVKTLATAHWNKGDLSKALEILKTLPSLMGSQPVKEQAEIQRMIGDLHRSLGDQERNVKARISRYDQALEAYKKGLGLHKGDKEIQKRKDELESERMALVKRSLKSS
jgi:tetratricopeptide (TPR) repeat protein